MEGFTEVSIEKVETALNNYDTSCKNIEDLEKSLEPEITKQVSGWGWYAKWNYELAERGVVDAWIMRYNRVFDSRFDTYAQQGLITKEQVRLYDNVFYSSNQKSDLKSLVGASSTDFIYFNQTWSNGVPNKELLKWIEQYDCKVLKTTTDSCSYQKTVKGLTEEVMVYKLTNDA